jgi:hypothetical protein
MYRNSLLLYPFIVCVLTLSASPLFAVDIANGKVGFKAKVVPFFKANCISCHGPKKSKGKITLHTMDGDLTSGLGIDHWEHILDALKSGEMPPEDEDQPSQADRAAVVKWIDEGLRQYVKQESKKSLPPTARRLTNFEYQNSMRDLLGFQLELIKNLPEDPIKAYEFNNNAHFMLMGMEQLDRYKENARRAMASAIVDPKQPKIHKSRREWKPSETANPTTVQGDEIGGRRGSPGGGMGVKTWPKTGEFKVRIKAAGIFPNEINELPLRLVMGYNLGVNSSTLQVEPLGRVTLKGNLDNPEIFEFRGRIENFPVQPRVAKGKTTYSMTITPQVIYDDGRRNDYVNRMKKPRAVVKWIEFEGPVFEAWPPKHHTDILFESPLRKSNPEAYVREVLKRFMTRAFRRPVKKEEVDNFAGIYKIISKDLPLLEEAMRETLTMVLISPDFMYHTVAKNEGSNRHYEMASKLSYFLWGSMPDKELFDLAEKQKLNDSKIIEAQVQRLLKDKRSKDFIENFTLQWLSISKMKQVAINKTIFPRFLYVVPRGERAGLEVPYIPTVRDYMMDETVGFMAELIKRNAPVTQIVDSDFAMLNQRLAAHYGVKGVVGDLIRPVPIKPEHNLGGLLTQGTVLIGNSTGTAPHPIYRAVWLREAILGDDVKDPPADIPSLSETVGDSAEKALSIKDLLVQHRQKESCNDCHVRLDPWGVPFEQYNAIGQFQPMVPKEGIRVRPLKNTMYKELETLEEYDAYLKTINTQKVEADARVPHGPKVTGMKDLKKHLIKDRKGDIAQNMIRRLLTYGLGRELSYRDRYDIEKLLEQSKKNSYKLQDMITSICQSKTFTGEK